MGLLSSSNGFEIDEYFPIILLTIHVQNQIPTSLPRNLPVHSTCVVWLTGLSVNLSPDLSELNTRSNVVVTLRTDFAGKLF